MKKKLTKEQKEKRQHFLKVTKNVVFYISLALNVLVAIAFAITGCSPKSNVQSYERIDLGDAIQLRKQKAKVLNNDSGTVGYDLTYPQYKGGVTYNGSFTTTLDNAYTIGTPTEDTLAPIVEMSFNININDTPVYGNHISYSVNGNENIRTYTYNGQWWTITGYNVIENIYINPNNSVTNETFVFYHILQQFFDELTPIKYRDLNDNWSPLSYLTKVGDFLVTDQPGKYTIISNGLLVCNGVFYDELYCQVVSANAIHLLDKDGNKVLQTDSNYSYVGFVALRNSKINKTLIIMTPRQFQWKNNDAISYYFDGTFETRDFNMLKIYQYDYNLAGKGNAPLMTLTGYNNGTALDVSSTFSLNGSSVGDFGDVFGLIGTAFNGLTSLLAIKVLPGITLGILFFVPVIAFIVFAIVRVIKK